MSAAHKYIDLDDNFDGATEQADIGVEITMAGIPGKITRRAGWIGAHGPWASHTGYQSVGRRDCEPQQLAAELYEANAKLPFLVGEEHREHGWRSISTNWKGEVQVKLPHWNKGTVAACIEGYGMTHSCSLNNYWTFPIDTRVTKELVSKLLAPIASSGTRFSDEKELARQIDGRAIALGYLPGQKLSEGAMQTSLF